MLPPNYLSWLDEGIRRSDESGGDGGDDDDDGGDGDDGSCGDSVMTTTAVIEVMTIMMKRLVVLVEAKRGCYDMGFRILCHTRYR